MYKRQFYQIAESNRIERIDSVARIESKLFLLELECSTPQERMCRKREDTVDEGKKELEGKRRWKGFGREEDGR